MPHQFANLPEDLRQVIYSLAGGEEIYSCAVSEDRSKIHLRLFIDGAPYLHSYERTASGGYQLIGANALGQLKF